MRMSPLRRGNMSYDTDNDDTMEEDLSVISSPPKSASKTRLSQAHTPRSRRLVFEGSEDAHAVAVAHSHSHTATLKPLDLNFDQADEGQRLFYSTSNPGQGRKRTSGERRSEATATATYTHTSHTYTPHRQSMCSSQCMDTDSNSNEGSSVYSSPHISPNSFITMDGRFVHSKNPFSSPMVTEQSEHAHEDHPLTRTTNVNVNAPPALPVNFYDSKPLLPPRSALYDTDIINGGYPDKKFSFTGSPIKENEDYRNTGGSTYYQYLTETDAATSGSLHKVRRYSKNDDVFKASGQHFQAKRRQLTVDTSTDIQQDVQDEISPTDVINFPPPTPMKAKQQHAPPYASIRRLEPPTPVMERRRRTSSRYEHTPTRNNSHQTDELNSKSRFYSDFDIIGELGKGSFGTVYKVLSRLDGCMYAIKVAQRQAKGHADRDRMLKEVYALAALSDQADTATFHIVRYHQAWMEDERLYIQTELCTGNLREEIARSRLTLPRRYKLIREISLALAFIHRNNMVHLDIKPDNVFIKNDQFKLGDFGLVTKTSNHQDVEEGDSRYMSMELLSGDHEDLTKSDIFSLGATIYEICLGRELPMNGDEWQDIRSGKLQSSPGSDPDLVQLIHLMMRPDFRQRPTAVELLKRPQLLSEEQKALIAEKSKVAQANMELAAQAEKFKQLSPLPPPRKGLQRANTWNGSAFPSNFPY